jgi:hypothetical protein
MTTRGIQIDNKVKLHLMNTSKEITVKNLGSMIEAMSLIFNSIVKKRLFLRPA